MAVPTAHVIFCLDCSASMRDSRDQTEEAFNTFVRTLQKTKGAEVKLTLIEYRDNAKVIYKLKPIQDVELMDHDYYPNSGDDTLYDVVHFAVALAEREKGSVKTVICILCDGGDTCSTHNRYNTRALVEKKLKEGIEFCFLAAGNNASLSGYRNGETHEQVVGGPQEVARRIGIPPESIIQYGQKGGDKKAIAAFGASAWGIGAFSAGRAAHVAFTDEQKKAVGS